MMYLIVYSIMVYGLANALVYFNGPFNIIDRFRNWIGSKHETFEEMFSCMFCLPTNIGIALSIIALLSGVYFTPFTDAIACFPYIWPLAIICDGFYAGGVTYLIHSIQQRLEKIEDKTNLLMD